MICSMFPFPVTLSHGIFYNFTFDYWDKGLSLSCRPPFSPFLFPCSSFPCAFRSLISRFPLIQLGAWGSAVSFSSGVRPGRSPCRGRILPILPLKNASSSSNFVSLLCSATDKVEANFFEIYRLKRLNLVAGQ